jgi:hypothetical protein
VERPWLHAWQGAKYCRQLGCVMTKAKRHEYMQNLLMKLEALRSKFQWSGFGSADLRSLAVWILSTVPLSVSLSLVISTGPTIQSYLFSLIRSDAPSIYGSAYQDHLVKFPNLQQWLMTGLSWPFLLTAAAIVCFSLRRRGARQVFISSVLASFVALSIHDLLAGIFEHAISAAYLLENVVADAVGAALLALILMITLVAGNLCFVNLRGPSIWRQLVTGVAVLIVGVCLNSATFYFVEFFYRPVPVKLDVVLDYPVSGTIAAEANQNEAGNAEDQPFRLFPPKIDDTVIHWISPDDENRFTAEWRLLSNAVAFDATIEFYADCFNDQIGTATSVQGHQVRIIGLNSLSLSLDPGASEFGTVSLAKMSGSLVTDFGTPTLFSLDIEAGSKRIKITEFVQKNALLKVRNDGRALGFYVNAPLMAAKEQGIAAKGRSLLIKVDGKSYSVEAEKPRAGKKFGELECKSLEPKGILKQERAIIAGASSYLGALVRIVRRPATNSVYGIEDNLLEVFGGNGWVSLTRPSEQAIGRSKRGKVELVAFKGNIASLDIDNQSKPGRPIDQYTAFGEFTGDFEDSAKVRFSGRALALWKNAARVNPTKWERLSWEQRLAILGAIFSVLGSVVGYIAMQIRKNINITWRANSA